MTALVTFIAGMLVATVGLRRLVGARVTRGVKLAIARQEREQRVRRLTLYAKLVGVLVIVIALLAVAR